MNMSAEALDDLVMLINQRSPEKDKRISLAAAKAYGHGGKKRLNNLTGMAFSTLHRGKDDVEKELNRSVAKEAEAEHPPAPTDKATSTPGDENNRKPKASN